MMSTRALGCLGLACALLAAGGLSSEEGAKKAARPKTPSPTKVKVKPLGLEWELLGHLARSGAAPVRELEPRAAYLKRFGGEGFTVAAAHPDRRPADEHVKTLQAAHVAFTSMPLRDAVGRVEGFYRTDKVRIQPSGPTSRDGSADGKIRAYLASVEGELESRERTIDVLRSTPTPQYRGFDPGVSGIQSQIEQTQRQIARLQVLQKDLQEMLPVVARYEPLEKEILELAARDRREFRASELARRVSRLPETDRRVLAAVAVGTHQVRLTVGPELRKAAEAELARRLEGEKGGSKAKAAFIEGGLGFLPGFWPESLEDRPRGDFRVTEYLCEDEAFLTVFDVTGLWYRITAVESGGRIHLLVPAGPLDPKAK